MLTDIVRLLHHVTGILDDLGIPYLVGGSLASSQYGEVRATNDIDLMVDLPLEKVQSFVTSMKPSFDIWEDTIHAAVAAGQSFGALHMDWHVKVDFFLVGPSPLDAPSMARRRAFRLRSDPSREICFATAEDTILRKLDWFRKSNGILERQLRDVRGILKLQRGKLDQEYLEQLAERVGLEALLQQCMADAGLADPDPGSR